MFEGVIKLVCAVLFVIRSKLREWFGLAHPPPTIKRWCVEKAYLFCEPNDTPLEPDDSYFVDVGRTYDIDYGADDVADQFASLVPSSWPSWRCELRFRKGNTKRRIVFRPGETFSSDELGMMRSTRFSPKARVVRAWMLSTRGKRVDVTERVEKYVLHKDRRLHPLDLFPFDVEDELIEHFGVVFVETVSATGRVDRHEFVFADADADLVTLV